MISMFTQQNNNNNCNHASNKGSPTTCSSSPSSHLGTPHGIQDILARPTAVQTSESTSPRDKGTSSPTMNSPSSVSSAGTEPSHGHHPSVPVSLSLGSMPRFSFPSSAPGMAYFNPAAAAAAAASTGLHKLAAGLAASDLSVARAQQFYWPQMVQNQACLWRDRLANSGKFLIFHFSLLNLPCSCFTRP